MKHINLLLLACLLVSALGAAQPLVTAYAATTITVANILTDDTTAGNGCSLREAITNANNDAITHSDCPAGSGSDTILFASSLNGIILLGTALPPLSDVDGLSINGGANKITVRANGAFRVFEIPVGASVTLQNLTIADGSGDGANIYNMGTLNLQSSILSGGIGTNGGAIHNAGGTVSVTNSTFTGNTADFGAAIFNNLGTVTVTNSTINDNTISGGGTGILYNNGTMTVKNTIVADGNGAALCAGNALNFASTNNLADDVSCGPSFLTWTLGQLALGPLANNGGSTSTFGLLPASVAINAGSNASCPAVDQRGTGRPQGTTCDVGSFESKISLTVSPTSLAFGNSVIGVASLPKTVKLANTGEANLIVGVITITTLVPGEFNIVNDLCSGNILIPGVLDAPGTFCTFGVTFAPTTNIAKNGTVFIPTNILASPTTIALSGTGIFGTNMILNPGFEYPYKQPIGWRNPAPPYTLNSVVDKTTGYLLSCCSLRLPGLNKLVYLYQAVSSAGKIGFRFYISLSSKADNITLVLPSDVYKGELIFRDRANRPTEVFTFTFTPGTHDWEKLQYTIVTTKDYYNFIFRISVKSPTGVAWFDNATVIRLP